MKKLTKESFLAGAKFQYAQCPFFNPIMWHGNGLIYIAGQVITHIYPVRNHNDFGFFVDRWNDPDAIAFTEYNDYALCENED